MVQTTARHLVGITQEVSDRWNALYSTLPPGITEGDRIRIRRAFEVAYEAHRGTFRASREPYITHSLDVALIVSRDFHLDAASIAAAILHDVVEDTPVPLAEIRVLFGEEVARLVEGMTKIKSTTPLGWWESKQVADAQRFFCSLVEIRDGRVILIKLADRLMNMRGLDVLPKVKRLSIASETKIIYAPIAHRLGLVKVQRELEDLYLKTVNPTAYREVERLISKRKRETKEELQGLIARMEQEMKKQGLRFRIEARSKSVYSIYRKLYERNLPFEEIYDVVALRIILTHGEDHERVRCWQVYGILAGLFVMHNKRTKDWINTPRSNGYEALHVTFLSPVGGWVEVQIKTERMHAIASYGIASHWQYKGKTASKLTDLFSQWLDELSQVVHQGGFEITKALGVGNVEEIQVFSDTGELVLLPKGATLLDFAIELNGEKGLYCAYGRISNASVPTGHVLSDHDQVVLEFDDTKKPDKGILQDVTTPKAIRVAQAFFKGERDSAIAVGRRALQRAFALHKIPYTAEYMERFRAFLDGDTLDNVLVHLANKAIPRVNRSFQAFAKEIHPHGAVVPVKKVRRLRIGRDNESAYAMAKCCAPIPGDRIFGVNMQNGKVTVHAFRCKESNRLLAHQRSRIVETYWYNPKPVEARFRLKALKSDDCTQRILGALNAFEIQSILLKKTAEEDEVTGNVTVLVRDIQTVIALIKNLGKVEGVQEVKRLTEFARG